MAVQFSVESFKEMQSASEALIKYAEEYAKLNQRLQEAVQSLADQAAYLGEDYDIYYAKVQDFCVNLDAMAKKLKTGGEALGQQAQNYMSTQSELADIARKL